MAWADTSFRLGLADIRTLLGIATAGAGTMA